MSRRTFGVDPQALKSADKKAAASVRPRKSKVKTRNLDAGGVPSTHRRNNLNHTSYRLDERSRTKLRDLARRTFGGTTMSAVLRLLIDEAWAREYGRGKTRRVGRAAQETPQGATVEVAGSRFRLLSEVPDSRGGVDWYDATDPDIIEQVLHKERYDRTFRGETAEGVRVARELRAAGLLLLPPLPPYPDTPGNRATIAEIRDLDQGYHQGDL